MGKSGLAIHFIGIGGIGMSGIAKILLQQGYKISGSDLNSSSKTEALAEQGASVFIGHKRDNIPNETDLVVVSSAVPDENIELREARERGIEILQRGEMLAKLMEGYKGITVAGAHGKTTITAMIALCLEYSGLDPSISVGGDIKNLNGNAKLGKGQFFVAEADESDGSFLKLNPYIAVVSNIASEHMDYYKTFDKVGTAFKKHIQSIVPGGYAVLCIEDSFLREIAGNNSGVVITYGNNELAEFRVGNIQTRGYSSVGEIFYSGKKLGDLELNVPGRHNMINALAVVAVCSSLGIKFNKISEALKEFKGVQRRFQVLGIINDVTIVDDYAHHPVEIAATLDAARQINPKRIISIFQPHRYSRTKYLYREFGRCFSEADLVIINDIYSAGEKPMADVDSGLIVNAIRQGSNKDVVYLPGQHDTINYLKERMRSGDMILTLGAGDVWKIGSNLLEESFQTCKS